MSSSASILMDWTNLEASTFRGKQFLEERQLAKDDKYLDAVLELWEEGDERGTRISVETSPFDYCAEGDDNKLHGHIIRRSIEEDKALKSSKLPGILLFHTAAGPQDVFLFYKAHVLLQKFNCVVMICDILSDKSGWAWGSDRTQYNREREALMADDGMLLRSRVLAAGQELCENILEVDSQRLAAMGWCLGGQPILELARARPSTFCVKAMSTFHGVFRRDKTTTLPDSQQIPSQNSEIMICNGMDDPFVSEEDLDEAKNVFVENGYKVEVLQLKGAKHGFSNPAQGLNENPAFDYNVDAATKAWTETMMIFQRILL